MTVYGICLAQSGDNPLYNPFMPSDSVIFDMAAPVEVGKVPGLEVWILTFT
jgi:hypothetical protein